MVLQSAVTVAGCVCLLPLACRCCVLGCFRVLILVSTACLVSWIPQKHNGFSSGEADVDQVHTINVSVEVRFWSGFSGNKSCHGG